MAPVKLLVFSGSTRNGSLNTKLATAVAEMARGLGADVTQISLKDYPAPLFNQDWEKENGVPQSVKDLQALFTAHDAIFLASPEYNGGITPLTKNTLDWISRVKVEGEAPSLAFKKPVWSLGAASPGMLGGANSLHVLRPSLVRLGCIVMPEQLTVGGAQNAFNEDGTFANERTVGLATAQLERLIQVAEKLRG